MNLRWIITLVLAIAGSALQGQLWLSEAGLANAGELREAVRLQRIENDSLRERNKVFEAEVIDLKNGKKAAEERARNDLGLIGKTETFYHIVPGLGERMIADSN